MMTGTQVSTRAPRQQNFDVNALFRAKSRVVVGRASDCDLHLAHPNVSRYHARIERRDDGLYVSDLSSVNGVWLGGRRIAEPTRVEDGDRIGIGPFLLSVTHGVLHSLDNSKALRLEARGLEKVIPLPGGGSRKLLDNINLVVNPGEFVSLLGPSGSGKSTLMDCLNGRRRATGGQVLANGEDFYRHFDSFRMSLGYVPQRDIVHTQLTVQRALHYTAKLRLPPDIAPEELRARIEGVLQEMELVPHRDTLIANLSGGQIKRVSLGAELLGQPALLYIDEATSGLDAGTEARMMRLFRHLADEGRSILCITHNVDNVERCHLALVLARGKLVYLGPPAEAPRYFKVKRISEIYDRLGERDLSAWEAEFAGCSLYREFVADRLAEAPPPGPPPDADVPQERSGFQAVLAESRKFVESRFPPLADYFRHLEVRKLRFRDLLTPVEEAWNQLGVLTARYLELLRGDQRGLRLLLWQAPVVALFLLIGFVGQEFDRKMPLLRPLTPEERQALRASRALGELLDGDRPLTDQQKEALRSIQLEVAGRPADLDATAVVIRMRRLLRRDLSPAEAAALEQAKLTFTADGEPMTMTAADLVRGVRHMHEAKFSDRLLRVQGSVVPRAEGVNPRFTYMLLFILSMIVLWFGCNNAAKEIVKEEAIYSRERAVNLRIAPYLASKFLVLSVITILHAGVLMLLVYGALEVLARTLTGHSVPPAEHMLGYAAQFGVLSVLAAVGVALGLLLSACVSSPDRANALLPYVLIPQMILGGGILSVEQGALHWLAMLLSPVYWAYRAIHLGAHELAEDFPGYVDYADGIGLPCLAMAGQLIALLALTWWFLKCKDV
ncbi:MAG: ATP-binding cassette domain-containing protein [Gemmataceae bacterium]